MREPSTPANAGGPTPDDGELDGGTPSATKTPFFKANHAERYQRQALIKGIQERTQRILICYVSGSECAIDRDDTVPFVDLLHNVPRGRSVDLLLHTCGGDTDVAEKLMELLRGHVGAAELRVIVPEFAKSAGTLMVLGADRVVMSDMSELGPIDPQIVLAGGLQPIQNFLDAYREHAETLKNDPGNIAARIMLEKLDPTILKLCEAAVDRARQAAEKLLRRGMFRNGGNYTRTARELLDTSRWLSHSQMISWEDARDPQIGLVVEHLEYHSDEWQDYWQLYCLQRLAVRDRQKLYESDYASLTIDGGGAK